MEWTGEYGYNVYGFRLDYYWFITFFPNIGKSFTPSYNLQQFGKLHLWVELKHSCPSRKWRPLGSEQPYPVSGKDCLLTYAGISIFWGPPEERNLPEMESDGRPLARLSWMVNDLWHEVISINEHEDITPDHKFT